MSAANGNGHPVREVSLLGALGEEWIKLPFAAMRDVGPAVQTLGGLLKITTGETFVPVSEIASKARVPAGTCRKHLDTLHANGWIANAGRQRTRRGNPRRTCTIRLTAKAKAALEPFGFLPWWTWAKPFGWSSRALLSVVMAELSKLRAAALQQDCDKGEEELVGQIENMDTYSHFRFSLHRLEESTGMDHKTIAAAKRSLVTIGCVVWERRTEPNARGMAPDFLLPNWDFRAVITDKPNGMCTVKFVKQPAASSCVV